MTRSRLARFTGYVLVLVLLAGEPLLVRVALALRVHRPAITKSVVAF